MKAELRRIANDFSILYDQKGRTKVGIETSVPADCLSAVVPFKHGTVKSKTKNDAVN